MAVFMKDSVWLVGSLLGFGALIGSAAHESNVPPRLTREPISTPVMSSVMDNAKAQLFAGIVRASELNRQDLGIKDVTFLAARDATCTLNERALLQALTTNREAARAYVLDHAFEGQLNVLPGSEDGQPPRAYYFPDAGTLDVLSGRVTIDSAHPFNMPLLSGNSVPLTLSDGILQVGSRATLLHNNNGAHGGNEFELDHCAMY
jgi:hypothetical protein